jgi:hypothetical protein
VGTNGSSDHEAVVRAWLAQYGAGLSSQAQVDLLARAFDALWQRASRPLGDVTLTAIVGRVLCVSAEHFTELGLLKFEQTTLRCEALREAAAGLPPPRLLEAIRFVLVQFLSILGHLTAEILSPALHAELARVGAAKGRKP